MTGEAADGELADIVELLVPKRIDRRRPTTDKYFMCKACRSAR
jgi:hypothetical protein